MNSVLESDDNAFLRGTLDRLLTGHPANAALWPALTALSLPALIVPENFGGIGGDARTLAVVGEVLGRHLAIVPFVASSVLATTLLLHTNATLRDHALPGLTGEAQRATLADLEGRGVSDAAMPTTHAIRRRDGWVLYGEKVMVDHADRADRLLVTAMTDEGLAVFEVASTAGLTVSALVLRDGTPAADLHFAEVAAASASPPWQPSPRRPARWRGRTP